MTKRVNVFLISCIVLSLRVPVSSLLVLGAVHHYLIEERQRMKVGLILETAEAREVHHICLLLGYGADAICPYLVFEMARNLRADGVLDSSFNDNILCLVSVLCYFWTLAEKKYNKIIDCEHIVELCGSNGERYSKSNGENGDLHVAVL